jgi:hypothetical protein
MSNKLRERNTKVIQKILLENEHVKGIRDSMKARFNLDPMTETEKFPVLEQGFSWRSLEKKLSLREADASSSFSQFLRAGVQNITNAAYQATDTTFEDWVTVVPSSKDTELYAPNHGVAFPRQVGPGELYPEVGAAALDIQLKNFKYGDVYAIQKELLNDDQTGSFQQQAALMGEYMKIIAEVLCYGKLASVANMQYIDYKIPVSETKPSTEANYPWSQALVGGGATRPATYAVISQPAIQAGFVALANQKNLQGIKMMVRASRIICGHNSRFDTSVLLNSAYYPSGASAAAVPGGAFAINPIQGIADLTVSRFVFKNDGTVSGDSKAWYLVDDSKPFFIQQLREPVSVEAEAPNAGESFNRDIMRWKASCRMNADFLDPRFAWQGNDGSITS